MKKQLLLFFILCFTWMALPGQAQELALTAYQPHAPLNRQLDKLAHKWGVAQAGIMLVDLNQQKRAEYQSDKVFPMAEFSILPLWLELNQQLKDGSLSNTPVLTVRSEHIDGPTTLLPGQTITLNQAIENLIQTGDSAAALMLMEAVGYGQMDHQMQKLGLLHTRFSSSSRREIQPQKAETTAHDMAALLLNLQNQSPQSVAQLKAYLRPQPTVHLSANTAITELHTLSNQNTEYTHRLQLFQIKDKRYLFSFFSGYSQNQTTSEAVKGLISDVVKWLQGGPQWQPKGSELVPGIYLSDRGFQNKVVLTFDDGPNHNTERVLNILKKHGVKATFFVLGQRINAGAREAALIRRMDQEGHSIGNHSYSHPNLAIHSPAAIRSQLERTNRAIQQALGYDYTVRYFRPPYGVRGSGSGMGSLQRVGKVDYVLKDLNQALILWQADSLDWKAAARRMGAGQIASNVYNQLALRKGGVVLFHDIHRITGSMLDSIITRLKAQGYQFVTLDDIMSYKYDPS